MNFALVISCLLGFGLTYVFQEHTKAIFITFGQGHFLLAYLYMYKAGKISVSGLIRYIGLFALLILLYWYVLGHTILLFITALYFIVHFVLDIFFLNRESGNKLILTIPFFWISLSRLFLYLGFESASDLFFNCYPFTLLIIVFRWRNASFSQWLLILFSIVIYLHSIIHEEWTFHYFMSIIMISHYLMWYLYFLVNKDKAFIRPFLVNVFVVNAILVMGFCYYFFKNQTSTVGNLLFHEDAFYLWTLMHYASTVRLSDFRHLLNNND